MRKSQRGDGVRARCLGYGIAALRLRADGDWDVFFAYLPDGGEAQP